MFTNHFHLRFFKLCCILRMRILDPILVLHRLLSIQCSIRSKANFIVWIWRCYVHRSCCVLKGCHLNPGMPSEFFSGCGCCCCPRRYGWLDSPCRNPFSTYGWNKTATYVSEYLGYDESWQCREVSKGLLKTTIGLFLNPMTEESC